MEAKARRFDPRNPDELRRLFDLRHVTTSAQMATELLDGISKGFNDGVIQPTGMSNLQNRALMPIANRQV